MTLPANLAAIRDEAMRTSCEGWALRKRWRLAPGIDRAGPCPVCGGTDRFAIHTKKNTFNCRVCGIAGGGVIDLVMQTEGVEFLAACEMITGRKAEAAPDPARMEALRSEAVASEAAREAEAERYREQARRDARAIWEKAWPVESVKHDVVAEYFRIRGLGGGSIDLADRGWARALGLPLRCNKLDYWHDGKKLGEAPVMIAPIQFPDGHFAGVHLTWLDPGQPKGKLALFDAKGGELPAKKVRGVHRGCAIRLVTPPAATRLVMGEGIETTMTAVARAREFATAYWAGVALGNMSGKAARKPEGGWLHDQPDLDDINCFLPPDWCEELVYLCDSDAPRNHTEEKVVRGLKRALLLRQAAIAAGAALPPLVVSYVPPLGEGMDLNDLVRVTA